MPAPMLGRPTPVPLPGDQIYDADAADYLRRVEAADGAPLEHGIRVAINALVVSLKNDGTWGRLGAACILMGARTLSGALTPLVGPGPTNANFVTGDYNRRTGLLGNGSTKNLNSNRAQNADPQDDVHMAVYVTTAGTNTAAFGAYFGVGTGGTGDTHLGIQSPADFFVRMRSATADTYAGVLASVGLIGVSRNGAAAYSVVAGSNSRTTSRTSQTPGGFSTRIFSTLTNGSDVSRQFINGRLSYYSIGRAVDLPALQARLDQFVAGVRAAI